MVVPRVKKMPFAGTVLSTHKKHKNIVFLATSRHWLFEINLSCWFKPKKPIYYRDLLSVYGTQFSDKIFHRLFTNQGKYFSGTFRLKSPLFGLTPKHMQKNANGEGIFWAKPAVWNWLKLHLNASTGRIHSWD